MSESYITRAGKLIKAVTGIKDLSLFKKKAAKKIGKIIYHKTYGADDVIAIMRQMGMTKGSVVCIHAAMREFYNYTDTPLKLIQGIMDVITTEGTLIMPAYPDPKYQSDPDFVFDIKKEKTKAGMLAETFRTMPNVMRSINVQHSVCAWGKYAKELTSEHQESNICWDKKSPWYKMTQFNALVFSLGLEDYYIGTFDHCVEALLHEEHPYWSLFFNEQRTFKYYDSDRQIKTYTSWISNIERRTREKRLIKYFTDEIFKKRKISNLKIKVFYSKPCLDIMLKLGRKGITMYYVPSPKKYKFEN